MGFTSCGYDSNVKCLLPGSAVRRLLLMLLLCQTGWYQCCRRTNKLLYKCCTVQLVSIACIILQYNIGDEDGADVLTASRVPIVTRRASGSMDSLARVVRKLHHGFGTNRCILSDEYFQGGFLGWLLWCGTLTPTCIACKQLFFSLDQLPRLLTKTQSTSIQCF